MITGYIFYGLMGMERQNLEFSGQLEMKILPNGADGRQAVKVCLFVGICYNAKK